MTKRNEAALLGATPETAERIRAKADADDVEKHGAMPDPAADPEAWKFRMFRMMYRALEYVIAANSAPGRITNEAVKAHWNRLFTARPDLVGAEFETIREAFKAEYISWKTDQDAAGRDARAKADAYLAERPSPLNAPRPKRIGEPPVTRKIGDIPMTNLFPSLPAEQPAQPKPVDPELAAAFPRDTAGNPITEPPADLSASEADAALADAEPTPPPAARWQDDDTKLDAFRKAVRAEIDRVFGQGSVTVQGVNDIMKAALGGTLDQWQDTGGEALNRIKAYLKAQQPPDENPTKTAPNSGANEPSHINTQAAPEMPRQTPQKGQSERPSNAVVVSRYEPVPVTPETASWAVEMQRAQMLLDSGFMPPSIKTVAQVFYLIEMARLLDVPLLAAINGIDVINNRIHLKPVMMMGLINRSRQLEALVVKSEPDSCTVIMTRKGKAPHTEKFTMSDAAAMGLTGKDNWRKQPVVMLKWRAISAAARVVFPDVIWGLYLTDEIQPEITNGGDYN